METKEIQVMTKEEVAKLLRVSEHTIDNWRAKNGLPCHRVGNVCRFARAEVLEWFASICETNGDQGKEAEKNDR